MSTEQVTFAFKCPVHGVVTNGFCWRAFMPKYESHWFKVKVTIERIDFDKEEIIDYIAAIEVQATRYGY